VDFEDGQVKVTSSENGAEVTLGGEGAEMPKDWPAAFPLYPGATLKLSYLRKEDGGSRVVMLTATEVPDKLIAFYRAKSLAEGFSLVSEQRTPGNWTQSYVTATRSFNLAVQGAAASLDVSLQLMEGRSNSIPQAAEVYWQGVDGLPPAWPLELLPPYPDGSINAAAYMPEEGVLKYRIQLITARPATAVHDFYRRAALKAGLIELKLDGVNAAISRSYEGKVGRLEVNCMAGASDTKVVLTLRVPLPTVAASEPSS
jgi:hypothetical protein